MHTRTTYKQIFLTMFLTWKLQ